MWRPPFLLSALFSRAMEPAAKVRRTEAYFFEKECEVEDLASLCEGAAAGSTRAEVVKGVPVYDCAKLDPQSLELRAEWAQVLMGGAGVLVLRQAASMEALDPCSSVFEEIICEEKQASSKGDHFAAPGANDRIWNAQEKLCLRSPAVFAEYYAHPWIDAVSDAWLGPGHPAGNEKGGGG